MAEIKKVTKKTENPYVNLYELDTLNRKGNPGKYYVASRAKSIQTLELTTGSQHSDGVIIYSLYGENHDKVVLVRQYRYAINGYIYELPAGLVEPGEDYHTSAVREMKEETGLDLHPLPVKNLYQKPYYTTIGMTDECCGTVYGYATGEISADGLEDTEEIEVVLADRAEVDHGVSGIFSIVAAVTLLGLAVWSGTHGGENTWLYALFGVLFAVYQPWTLFIHSAKQVTSNPVFKKPLVYEVNEAGITVRQDDTENEIPWSAVTRVCETSQSIFVYTGKRNAFIWVKSQLGNNEKAVRNLLTAQVPESRRKMKAK